MHKILLVEDSREVRNLIRLTLPFPEFQISDVDNADDALQKARDLSPDLVLLDRILPGSMDGIQICQAIKADDQLKRAIVVMLTVLGHDEDVQTGLSAGAEAYVTKPFSPTELAALVRRLLSAAPARKPDGER